MDLNKILSTGRWGDMAALVNTNFEKIRIELMKLRYGSILTFCKGYFSTEERFLTKFPTGKTGEYAFVGTPWPGTVWEWVDTEWVDSGMAPVFGDDIFMEMLKRHIDHKTILWKDAGKYIYSQGGGGGSDVFTVTVGMDETQGVHGKIIPAAVNTVKRGESLTITITPDSGYTVQRVNVDKVNHGAITEYTFENVQEDHTMYVWFQTEVEANPTDFLERSDRRGVYYSSIQSAFDAVKADYPSGLTQDVTIACIKENVTFKRDRSLWLAELDRFNKGTVFTLTVDGMDRLTLNCASLGGLRLRYSDNVVLRNISFTNTSNYMEAGSPEEMSAVMFCGDVDSYSYNLYMEGCRIDGSYVNGGEGRYGLIAKYAYSVYLCGCRLTSFNCIPLKVMDFRILSLVGNYVDAGISYGLIGHPSLCTVSNGVVLISEDNEFTGKTGEYLFCLTNVEHIFFRRNNIHDGGGEGIRISGKAQVKDLVLESNLFAGLLSGPSVAWAFHYILIECDAVHVSLVNNTGIVNGVAWQQWFMKSTGYVGRLDLYNNIIASGVDASVPMRGIALGTVGTINSGNNLYQVPLKHESESNEVFFSAEGLADVRKLPSLQNQGLELGSRIVDVSVSIFQSTGGAPYKLSDAFRDVCPADAARLAAADLEYKSSAASGNTIGCYNLSGAPIDETEPVTGYHGNDMDAAALFSEESRHTTYADNMLMLAHKTPDRKKFLKITATGEQHSALVLGRYGILHLLPVMDDNGEYLSDELYTINVE